MINPQPKHNKFPYIHRASRSGYNTYSYTDYDLYTRVSSSCKLCMSPFRCLAAAVVAIAVVFTVNVDVYSQASAERVNTKTPLKIPTYGERCCCVVLCLYFDWANNIVMSRSLCLTTLGRNVALVGVSISCTPRCWYGMVMFYDNYFSCAHSSES